MGRISGKQRAAAGGRDRRRDQCVPRQHITEKSAENKYGKRLPSIGKRLPY
jgi:hypothetical protein